mgnify:CR=1 FL=1
MAVINFEAFYVVRTLANKAEKEYFGGPFNNWLQAHTWALDNMILNQGAEYNIVKAIMHGDVVS